MDLLAQLTPRRSGTALGFVLALVLVVLTVTSPRPAAACSCIEPLPPQDALDETGAVFAGTVVGVRRVGTDANTALIAAVNVEQVWKGEVVRTVQVRTPGSEASCGLDFQTGHRWLVYAEPAGDRSFDSHLCGRTARAELATEDFEDLGDGTDPLPIAAVQPPPGEGFRSNPLEWTWILLAGLLFGGAAAGLLVVARSRREGPGGTRA